VGIVREDGARRRDAAAAVDVKVSTGRDRPRWDHALLKIVEARKSVLMMPRRPLPGRRRRVDVGCPRPSGRDGWAPEGVDVAP
jgi:hypothetical protein